MTGATDVKYCAFLSYSHKDTSWARWLHNSLEGYRVPRELVGRKTIGRNIPKSLRPIFRDRDDFSAGHTLTSQTLSALDDSSALIAICSPASAQSRYVNEEIRLFKSKHPDRPVIPLIIAGQPGASAGGCFPPALRFKVLPDGTVTAESDEVLAADARDEADGKELAKLKVVAGLLDIGLDEVRKREAAAQKRRFVALTAVTVSMFGLAVAAGCSAWLAYQRAIESERRLTYAQEASIDLVVLTSTLRATMLNMRWMDVYGNEKLSSTIFQKIAGESGMQEMECRKAHRLGQLSNAPESLLSLIPELGSRKELIREDWALASTELTASSCPATSKLD